MVRLYAHRGAAAERPENTLPAFRRALELGADALETDAHLTRDGQVVVAHDPDGLRMAGVGRAIRDCTLAQVQTWDAGWGFVDAAGKRPFAGQGIRVPTLEELLRELPGALLNVDVKQPDMVPAILALLERSRAQERVQLASFSSATLRRIRRLGYPGVTSLGMWEAARLVFSPLPLLRLFPLGGVRAQVPLRYAGLPIARAPFIARCHALGIAADFWTVNEPAEALRLVSIGADGIMTDDPAKVAPALGKLPR
jgi:glycerophosphoryl diester phosphodiesterase